VESLAPGWEDGCSVLVEELRVLNVSDLLNLIKLSFQLLTSQSALGLMLVRFAHEAT
jgi:hypothetical protein